MFIRYNELGGVEAENKEQLEKAKNVDLVTLPRDVRGTNCFNCKFIKNKMIKHGYCSHPKVSQNVNGRMCCILWSATGEHRQFKGRSDKLKE